MECFVSEFMFEFFGICCEFCLPILNLCVCGSSKVVSSSGVLMSVNLYRLAVPRDHSLVCASTPV